ncbi:hypothetical protein GIB67_024973 [Kingdonia uniflora]|uniref:Uncharacterized protein n=1 Tax=Kingdonia uniflora TaxID=39325 RepID=A0A7J7NYS5_9MAGN|nr:hypothetical protein GIB67_024973 [Kingdonia uniflora]
MEENSKASSGVQVMGVDNNDNAISHSVKVEPVEVELLANGELQQDVKIENKEKEDEEEEAALEREFIKVEKESFDLKDSSDIAESEATEEEHHRPSVVERSLNISVSTRHMLEAEEKAKELELELERVAGQLKHSESENASLREEVFITKEKLESTGKYCEDLELNQKKLKEQILEAEAKCISQENTLQEALQAHEGKHKELIDVRELSDGITIELENSKKKMQELELELQSSAIEAQKFEVLSRQSGSHAETETQRALELERLLELAKSVAKKTEDQMTSLQKEVKDLYEKIAEIQKVEEALSAVQGEMEISKSHILELQQRLTSEEAVKNDLAQELDLRKASEEQMKEDILALENLYLPTKEDLKAKISELEEIKLTLGEQLKTRESVEIRINEKEEHIKGVEKELIEVTGEKVVLEAAVADLNNNLKQMKELCSNFETKLKLSDENFLKADSLLSEALSNNMELEQKLKSLENLHQESGVFATATTEKNLQLEDIIQTSVAAAEEAKLQLREMETELISVKQKNVELEQQLNLVELEKSHAEREATEKTIELNAMLGGLEEEKRSLQSKMKEFEEKITHLESSLSQFSSRNIELEKELKDVVEKSIEHKGRADTTHQRSVELEDLVQVSNSKAEDAGRKFSELELLMEAANCRVRELEEQISTLETKCLDKESESQKLSDKVSVLASELGIFQATASDLEIALKTANEKKGELMDCLNVVTEERKKFEDTSNSSIHKLSETENMLKMLQEDHESIRQDLKVSEIREAGIVEKLKSSDEQLNQAMARNSELESQCESLKSDLNESLMKLVALESAVDAHKSKIFEAENKTSQSFSENEMLAETNLQLKIKINELEELLSSTCAEKDATSQQLALHMTSIAELTDQHSRALEFHSANESRIRGAETQLEESIQRFTHRDLEATELSEKLNELETKLRIHEDKAAQLEKESEGIAEANLKLSQELMGYESKMNELRNTLSTSLTEKDKTLEQLQSSKKTVEELTQQLASEGEKLQSQISTIMEENNTISETYQDARKELQAVIVQLEAQLNEQKATEENLKVDLGNMKAGLVEKTALQALVVDLEQQLTVSESRLKEEVKSIQVAAAEKEAGLVSKLDEHVSKLQDKDIADEKVQQLQKDLDLAHTMIAQQDEEVKKLTIICQEIDDLKIKSNQTAELEKNIQELENKLKLASISSQDQARSLILSKTEYDPYRNATTIYLARWFFYKGNVGSGIELKDGVDVKSRDIGSMVSTPSKRKSKKRSEAQASSSSQVPTQSTEVSSVINYNLILGIALVSVIIGIILGKRY